MSGLCKVDIVTGVFVCVKQKTAYERRISDWSADVCSSDLIGDGRRLAVPVEAVSGDVATPVRHALRLAVARPRRRDLPTFRPHGGDSTSRLVVSVDNLTDKRVRHPLGAAQDIVFRHHSLILHAPRIWQTCADTLSTP